MRYAKIIENDATNGEGICVSFWAQGCPFHCKGCHNPETWDFDGGYEKPEEDIISKILFSLTADGVYRNLSILGGEPLCEENIDFIELLVYCIKRQLPDIKIYLWTGFTFDALKNKSLKDKRLQYILDNLTMLAAGPYVESERDLTLLYVGSRNQQVLWKGKDF